MPSTKITIIDPDTLRAVGLRHILTSLFDSEVKILAALPSQYTEDDSQTRYIITPRAFTANLDFFLTRRQRIAIIDVDDNTCGNLTSINPTKSESDIIDQLGFFMPTDGNEAAQSESALSQREIEVLRLVALGFINKEIADSLSISFNTVLTHRRNITSKLGIRSVSGLGVYALMNGYINENELKR